MTSVVPIVGRTKDNQKPAIVNYYNLTMGGTDIVDQLMSSKTVRWKSDRWTMSALAFMLDTCAVNAITIAGQQERRVKSPDTRAFRFQLVHDLVDLHIRRRMTLGGIHTRIKNKARDYLGKFPFFPFYTSQIRYCIVTDGAVSIISSWAILLCTNFFLRSLFFLDFKKFEGRNERKRFKRHYFFMAEQKL
jgi:hypothetical protein